MRYAYLTKKDPHQIQKAMKLQQNSPYYSSSVSTNEIYNFDNVSIKPIKWGEICGKMIIIGDRYSISDEQVQKNKLNYLFEVDDLSGDKELFAYTSNKQCN